MRTSVCWAAVAAAALVVACGSAKSTSPTTHPPSAIVVPAQLSLSAGTDTAVHAMVEDAGGDVLSGYHVMLVSSDTTVVRISADTVIEAVGPGSTSVVAAALDAGGNTVSGVSAQIAVTVAAPAVATVKVSGPSDSVAVGDSLQLRAVALSSTGDTLSGVPVTWSSSDTTLAVVSDSGLVHARAVGAAVITATSGLISGTDSVFVKAAASGDVEARRRRP